MQDIKIISDSSCDLPLSVITQHDIGLVPFYVTLDGQTYLKEHIEISIADFYREISEKNLYPRTSLPSVADYTEAFQGALEQGKDVLCICLSSNFSGSCQSAGAAASLLREQFPGRTVLVLDSQNATGGQGLLVLEAVYMKNAGFPLAEIAERLEKLKWGRHIIFTVDSLDYLQKGGRISNTAAFTGMLLNIKPMLFMEDGALTAHAKVRGRKKSLAEIVNLAAKELQGKTDQYRYAFLSCRTPDECRYLADQLVPLGIVSDIPLSTVGVTIGSHTGPTGIGIAFMRKFDRME